jgi:hypothetical protein
MFGKVDFKIDEYHLLIYGSGMLQESKISDRRTKPLRGGLYKFSFFWPR